MEMLISILAAFVVEVMFFTYLGRRLFPHTSSHQFVSLRAEREYGIKQQIKCRDSHMVEAGIVGLTSGLIACYFLGAFFLPVLGAMVTFESVWAVMTYEFRPELRQNYVIKSNLWAGTAAALVVGIVISFLAGASLLPVIIALVLFWVAWVLLMPM